MAALCPLPDLTTFARLHVSGVSSFPIQVLSKIPSLKKKKIKPWLTLPHSWLFNVCSLRARHFLQFILQFGYKRVALILVLIEVVEVLEICFCFPSAPCPQVFTRYLAFTHSFIHTVLYNSTATIQCILFRHTSSSHLMQPCHLATSYLF